MKSWLLLLGNLCMLFTFAQAQDLLFIHAVPADTLVAASNAYADPSLIKSLLLGKNYRKTWATPVQLPVFELSESPFQIERIGGSKQTNSLYLVDSNENVWVLRSVDKDVSKAYPSLMPYFPVAAFKQDLISANYPYGALVASELMKASGIEASQPVYYFVADDAALGEARPLFANTVCMLEKREPGQSSISTDTLKTLLREDSSSALLKKQLLYVRIMDMFIGDCDRHEDQFRWAEADSGNTRYFYAIPRDRDFVFFSSGGLIPTILEWITGRPKIRFTESSKKLKRLNHKAWDFDREYLQGLSEADWQEAAKTVLDKMTDKVLASAVSQLPHELEATDGKTLLTKLKSRRKDFINNVLDYYYFLFENK